MCRRNTYEIEKNSFQIKEKLLSELTDKTLINLWIAKILLRIIKKPLHNTLSTLWYIIPKIVIKLLFLFYNTYSWIIYCFLNFSFLLKFAIILYFPFLNPWLLTLSACSQFQLILPQLSTSLPITTSHYSVQTFSIRIQFLEHICLLCISTLNHLTFSA